jgi:hypothetical protein
MRKMQRVAILDVVFTKRGSPFTRLDRITGYTRPKTSLG